jgi:PAS domain S-box-containing protein
VRLSIPKKSPSSPADGNFSINPWRDAFLSGLAVAAAISLGAYVVYERAWSEKVSNVRNNVAELAGRLSRSAAGPHQIAEKLSPEEHANAHASLSSVLSYVRDNSEVVRRIYTFALDENKKLTVLDTGISGEKNAAQPLPPHARRALDHFRKPGRSLLDGAWTVSNGINTTAFSLLPGQDGKPAGIIGLEADAGKLEVQISTVRQALWFTCLLGIFVGAAAGAIVWRMRTRAAMTQEEILENRRTEDAIIASLGEVIYAFDPATDRFRWRGNVPALLGFTSDHEGEEKSAWLTRLHQDDVGRYIAAHDKAVTESRPMQIEYRVRRSDDSTIWVLDRSRPVPLRGGHVHLVGSLIDLTARRAAEETLRLFFDETATAHVVFEGDAIIDANPAAVALFAAGNEESLLAQPIWKLWPRRQNSQSLSAEAWSSHVLAAMEQRVSRFEWLFARLDGSLVDCDVFMRQATLHNRSVLIIACYDISPAKLAQAQLIESEQRFRDVSEAAGEFIWEVDHQGLYVYASRRVVEVLGLEPEALLGRSPFDFVPEAQRDEVRRKFDTIHAAGLAFRNFEHTVIRTDGSLLWISVSGVPIHDPAGQITGYRGASLDITKHRDYERELLLQKEAAESADRAKSSFLAMMSHEIRTPLNSVLGFAGLVLDTDLTGRQRDYLQTIKSSGDALLTLLNDILDFSKIESGRMEIEILPTDLPRCIREVLDLYRLGATARKLTLSTRISSEVPLYILTDASRLRQILVNLIGNAVKFTFEGGVQIDCSILHDIGSNRIRIVVCDTGIGISEAERDRLFRPFTQADSSTTRRFGGSGLGLAISKRLAYLLGGDLGLLKAEGAGSSFYLDLPVRVPSAEELEKIINDREVDVYSIDSSERFDGHPPHVLVVDDNTLNRRLTTHLLHQLGADTTVAASAAECFEKLRNGKFDLVLMDVQMPVMDGLDATRHIRSMGGELAALPIVALTADAMVGDRERCLDAGMSEYLTKPLRREELLRAVKVFAPFNGK